MQNLLHEISAYRRDLISDGYDTALGAIAARLPELQIHRYPTGSEVWDWTIPPKWECRTAYIARPDGSIIVSTDDHPLHVMSYSTAVDTAISHNELMKHVRSREDCPAGIPFEFSYYEPAWAFCIQHDRLHEFDADEYRVLIDSEFSDGELAIGEVYLPGTLDAEIVLTAHVCHPMQANDDASGCVAMVELVKRLRDTPRKYGLRFLWLPETIGTIAYLANEQHNIRYAIALDMLGNDNRLVLQHSPFDESLIDKAGVLVCDEAEPYRTVVSNDEKVYNNVGIPAVSISRARCWAKGEVPYYGYHTSLDTAERLHPSLIMDAANRVADLLDMMDSDWYPQRTGQGPICLSKHGLWVDWRQDRQLNLKYADVLDLLDGRLSVLDIAHGLELDYWQLLTWINRMRDECVVWG